MLKYKCFHLFVLICLNFGYMGIGGKHSMSQWDSLVGKGSCHQVWQSEFSLQNPYGRRKELTTVHAHTFIPTCKHISVKI